MIPAVCNSKDFVFCTEREASQYATNLSLVDQLQEAVKVWCSHLVEVSAACDAQFRTIDRESSALDPAVLFHDLTAVQRELRFIDHLDRDEVKAVQRVLVHDTSSQGLMKRLQELAHAVETQLQNVTQSVDGLSDIAALAQSSWSLEDIAEVLPPFFSALRALWVCTKPLGASQPQRFRRLLLWSQEKCETVVQSAGSALHDVVVSATRHTSSAKRKLVQGQQAIVGFQESYCELIEAVLQGGAMPHELQLPMDRLDWQFSRLLLGLEMIDVISLRPECAEGPKASGLASAILDDPVTPANELVAWLDAVAGFEVPNVNALINRVEGKRVANETNHVPVAQRRMPFTGLAVTVLFDPPQVTFAGAEIGKPVLREVESRFVNCFSMPIPVKGRPYVHPHFDTNEGVSSLKLQHVSSNDEQRTAGMLVVLDALEAEWQMTDTHASRVTLDEVFVFLMQPLR